jgi:hypothetical protein
MWMSSSAPVTNVHDGDMHSAHSLLIRSFTSIKGRKSYWKSPQKSQV